MLLDSGVVDVYQVTETSTQGQMPVKTTELVAESYFGDRMIGYGRQYAAAGASQRIDRLIRVEHLPEIRAGMIARIRSDTEYRIEMVQHLTDERGLRCTYLTLARLDGLYDAG
jgi:hypothetical protein